MMISRSLPISAALALLGVLAWSGGARSIRAIAQEADKPAVARPKAAPAEVPAPLTIQPSPIEPAAPAPLAKSAPGQPVPALPQLADPEAEETPEAGGIPPGMAEMFPVGRVFEGVRIPSYSGDGLSSVIHSQYMKRSDDEHLEMEMLEIVIYNAGVADTRILTDRAIFDTVAKTLRSTTAAKIVQEQVEMRGDRLLFDSVSRTGHLSGNVKTLIFNADQLRNPGGASK
jgi:hypothetical protein